MRNLTEELREIAVRSAVNTPKTRVMWDVWAEAIHEITDGLDTVESVLDLGSHLRDVFRTTTRERSQGGVSLAGRAWEGLVCWYLNLCMMGTRCVAMKYTNAIVPDSMIDAMTVSYGNTRVTSEADLVVLTFPDFPKYTEPLPENCTKKKKILEYMNENVRGNFSSMGLGIIQCKTNWNDSAQIPMLWNMIYNSQGFADQQISVGINNRSISQLKRFSYSFVTLPSQTNIKTNPGALHVARVRTLSGLNYWGMESVNNAVESLREIFDRNFGDGIDGGVRTSLERNLPDLRNDYNYILDPV